MMISKKHYISFYLFIMAMLFVVGDRAWSIENTEDRARFGMSASYNNLGEYKKAITLLKQLAEKYPDDNEVKMELARAFSGAGKVDEAIQMLEQILEKDTQAQQAIEIYAGILASDKQFEKLRDFYIELYHQEESGEHAARVGEISSWLNDYETAIQYYELAIKKAPQDKNILLQAGDVYFWTNNYQKASEYYDKANVSAENNPKRYLDMGICYLNLKQFNKAVEVFTALTDAYPDNPEYKKAMIDTYYSMGKVDEMRGELERIIKQNPSNELINYKLAEIYAAQKQYQKTIKLCENYLSNYGYSKDIKLVYARVLSWDKQYQKSIGIYDELIMEEEDNVKFIREKARVLGWDKQYDLSIEDYQKAIESAPKETVIYYEKNAKAALYNNHDKKATGYYINWLKIEPDNLEAMYDLAQVYSRQGKWIKADNMYGSVLDIDPSHFRAADALKKVENYARKIEFKTAFEFVEADSSGRDVDKRYWDVSASLRKAINENYYITAGQNNTWYDYSGLKQIYREKFSVGLEYFDKPDFWASANYAHSIFSGKNGVRNTFGGQLNFKPDDLWTISVGHQRIEVLDNGFTFRNKLYKDDYRVRVNYDPTRRIRFGGDFIRSRYSDSNRRDLYGFDAGYFLLEGEKSFKVGYRYEHYGFDKQNAFYFTPSSFHCHSIALEWKHFLNKQELYWGSNNTFYTIGYEVKCDSQREVGHNIKISFEHDWNNTCKSGLEWSKTIHETGSVYGDNRMMVYTMFYF